MKKLFLIPFILFFLFSPTVFASEYWIITHTSVWSNRNNLKDTNTIQVAETEHLNVLFKKKKECESELISYLDWLGKKSGSNPVLKMDPSGNKFVIRVQPSSINVVNCTKIYTNF